MTAGAARGNGEPLLSVNDLNVYYGRAHVLQGVSFEMGDEPVALIGRNGMGKTTLCNAIMQMRPPTSGGSIRFEGRELVGTPSYKVAGAGHRLRPAGPAAVPVAHRRRAPADGRAAAQATAAGRPSASTSCSRGSPSASSTAARSCRAASSRCSRSAARCSTNPQAADHGRAVRGARSDDHRDADRDLPRPRRRRACRSSSWSRTSAWPPRWPNASW